MQSIKPKKYLPGETKSQRKARKRREREQREVVNPLANNINETSRKNYVVCLKYGKKYDASYVNKLYSMVSKNITIDYEFVCFTEDPKDINPAIRIEPLPVNSKLQGWWYKPLFFNPNLPIKGTILFLDLDLVVFKNIDNLFLYKPGKFCIIRDFNRYVIKNYKKFNSSVFRLETGQHSHIYKEFIEKPEHYTRRFHGDQDLIRHFVTKDFDFWPDEWIQSYKWEMRGKPRFDNKPRGQRDFLLNGVPDIKNDTSIAVFHGDPNPHNCKDPWVIENWK